VESRRGQGVPLRGWGAFALEEDTSGPPGARRVPSLSTRRLDLARRADPTAAHARTAGARFAPPDSPGNRSGCALRAADHSRRARHPAPARTARGSATPKR